MRTPLPAGGEKAEGRRLQSGGEGGGVTGALLSAHGQGPRKGLVRICGLHAGAPGTRSQLQPGKARSAARPGARVRFQRPAAAGAGWASGAVRGRPRIRGLGGHRGQEPLRAGPAGPGRVDAPGSAARARGPC